LGNALKSCSIVGMRERWSEVGDEGDEGNGGGCVERCLEVRTDGAGGSRLYDAEN
jgi:hypothetical protein